jgi:3,5-epimerase/4-reductase
MRVLVFGTTGWIGGMFSRKTAHTVIPATTRPEDKEACREEIRRISPDSVCAFIGRTHGPGCGTIDYLEEPGRLVENMRDNYLAPMRLAEICDAEGIHFAYLGTGCIYTYTEEKRIFTEEDPPNFFGSSYSILKGYTDQEIRRYRTTLQLRIRMPISSEPSPRNLINKLVAYSKICSIPNSMTVLDDMWPILDRMIECKETGTYNMTNPGVVEHNWILEQWRAIVNPAHIWDVVTYEEQMCLLKSHRSNNELSTDKLRAFCVREGLPLPHIHDSIQHCIQSRI